MRERLRRLIEGRKLRIALIEFQECVNLDFPDSRMMVALYVLTASSRWYFMAAEFAFDESDGVLSTDRFARAAVTSRRASVRGMSGSCVLCVRAHGLVPSHVRGGIYRALRGIGYGQGRQLGKGQGAAQRQS